MRVGYEQGVSHSHLHWGLETGQDTFIFGCRNAYFDAFSGPSDLSICCYTVIRPCTDLQYACPVWHSRLAVAQSKRWSSCRRGHWTLSFLVVTRYKVNHCQRQNTESRRQQLSQIFFRPVISLGEHGPLAPSGSATGCCAPFIGRL